MEFNEQQYDAEMDRREQKGNCTLSEGCERADFHFGSCGFFVAISPGWFTEVTLVPLSERAAYDAAARA